MLNHDIEHQIKSAMHEVGLSCPTPLVADGKYNRFAMPGDKGVPCYYKIDEFNNGLISAHFGCHKRGISERWYNRSLSAQDIALIEEIRNKNIIKHFDVLPTETQKEVLSLWENAVQDFTEHAYLTKKQVKSYGLRLCKKNLLVPLYDEDNNLRSLHFITPNGAKYFKKGAHTAGCFFIIGESSNEIYICEGYATGASIYEATRTSVIISFNANNLVPVAKNIRKKYPNANIIICADNDAFNNFGNVGVKKATEAAIAINAKIAIPQFKAIESKPTDFNDLMILEGLNEVKKQLLNAKIVESVIEELPQNLSLAGKLKVVTAYELLQIEIKPREMILSPWLPTQSLTMIHAFRGVGKTHVSLNVAFAVAVGTKFLNWEASRPRGVLFLDGELPVYALKERLENISSSTGKIAPKNLAFLTPDLQDFGMPNLGTIEGQQTIEPYITDEIELIVVDNLSCLLRSGRENEAESWLPMQEWALRLRAKGKSILFIHHSGKSGNQRGSSKKEDILDTVISLKRPHNYTPDQGAVFEVHFEKSRYIAGADVMPFEAELSTNIDGSQCWLTKSLEASTFDKVVDLYNDGFNQKEIAAELNIHKSVVSRHINKAKAQGKLNDQ